MSGLRFLFSLWVWRLSHWRHELACGRGQHAMVELEPGYAYCWYCGHITEPGGAAE